MPGTRADRKPQKGTALLTMGKLSGAVATIALLAAQLSAETPADIDGWRVTIGPPGNEYYQAPVTPSANPPPSEKLISVVRTLAPMHVIIESWQLQYDGSYRARAVGGPERYDYHLAPDGSVIEIEFNNDTTRVREKAYALILKDSRRDVPLHEVPPAALAIIAKVAPDAAIKKTWICSTTLGPRYVIVSDNTAYYARPNGRIAAARLISEGGLEENYPRHIEREEAVAGVLAESEKLLGEYRERFNYENQVEDLGKGNPDAPFRFIVMGDSRSNEEFWPVILEHVSTLDPPPDFVINTGDLVPRGFPAEFREYLIPGLLELGLPYFTAIGNHESGYNREALEYRFLFGENSLNYFFDYSRFRFVFIDNVSNANPHEETIAWLDSLLSVTPENLGVIVSAHKPFRNIEKWAYSSMWKNHSEAYTELLSRHEVDHVFLGHLHAYSTETFGGVDYTVSGGGGAGLHDRFGPEGNVHHYIIVDAMPDGSMKQQVVRFRK